MFGGGIGFYVVQIFTAAILVLAANTSFQDFPRLSAILARDHFMPRQFVNRGDRLVFSNGVIGLAFFAGLLVVAFDADLNRSDPAVRRGGLHVVHPVADRHGSALVEGEAQGRGGGEGLAPIDRSSTRSAPPPPASC